MEDFTVPADDEERRPNPNVIEPLNPVVRIYQHGMGEFMFLSVFFRLLDWIALCTAENSENEQTLFLVSLPNFFQTRRRRVACPSPMGRKVQQHNPAPQVGQPDRFAVH